MCAVKIMIKLDTKIEEVSSIGAKVANKFEKLDVKNVQDLLFYFPFRYEDLSKITEIINLLPGTTASVRAKIQIIKNRRSSVKKRMLTEAIVEDGTASIKVIWFNQVYIAKNLKPGDEIYLAGKVEYEYKTLQFINPVYEKISKYVEKRGTAHTARLVPIYPSTGRLSQKQIRFMVKSVLPAVKQVKEWLPEFILKEYRLNSINWSINQIHYPDNKQELEDAVHRLKFDELLLMQLQAQVLKAEIRKAEARRLGFHESEIKKFVDSLPFNLTNDQRRASWEILKDIDNEYPMNRLLEGDVGSGKTVAAAIVCYNCILNSYQAAFMAPTEVLASQHFESLKKLFIDLPINIGLLTGSQARVNYASSIKRKKVEGALESGEINLIIGTHALIQDKIKFDKLALAVIDEQHRFGVDQRKTLREKAGGIMPHLLSMTATPIPRSLALGLYGDLDLSIIKELPKGRKKIVTRIVEEKNRKKAYEFILNQIKAGRQVFVICPLIDPSDKLGVRSVKEEFDKLDKYVFPNIKMDFLHGKMPPKKKEEVMQKFTRGSLKILVSTSVVEVGVDVPNATVMMIEGAERFGLAQLHQFRGRVGRSEYQSYCFLFSENLTKKAKDRLTALVQSNDGFYLAEKDLELRGPGEVYGTQQSGFPEFKMATLQDVPIMKEAQDAAKKIVDQGIGKYCLLQERLDEFLKGVHLE